MMKKVKVAVLGATGFTGEKLVELLLNHPLAEINYLTSKNFEPTSYSDIFPRFKNKINIKCEQFDIKRAIKRADIFFLALPHTVSMQIAPLLLKKKKKVIDLSADYRLKNVSIYKKFYKYTHKDRRNLKRAVYGLPEFFKDKIKKTNLVANPGCYPTSIILGLAPLLKSRKINTKIIIDAKSTITGAGRKALVDYHFSNINNNIWGYKPFIHQHLGEIIQILKDISGLHCKITFMPHVVGVESGIYSTCYVSFKKLTTFSSIFNLYKRYYKDCPFVRVYKVLPKLKDVIGTNFCDIGFGLSKDKKEAVVVSCLDNLIKGASGTAIQNMNIMCGFKEKEGLI